eukprot:417675_1
MDQKLFSSNKNVLSKCKSVDGCESNSRIMHALKDYSSLDLNSELDRNNLVKFCYENTSLLDDYIHVLEIHNTKKDLTDISLLLASQYQLHQCNINNCSFLARNYRNRNTQQNETEIQKEPLSDDFIFFRDTMDIIHCYFFHLYDTAMRVKTEDTNNHNNTIGENEDQKHYFDAKFSNMLAIIKHKNKNLMQVKTIFDARFYNNKFSINRIDENKEDTVIDGLISFMRNDKSISNSAIKIFQEIFITEEYDTDSVQYDADYETPSESNIAQMIKSEKIKHYMYSVKLHKYTFGCGYRFYYWEYYMTQQKEELQDYYNQNDHGGYKEHELFIAPKWNSIKEEIINNKFCPLPIYQFNISLHKCSKYIYTKKVKKTKRSTSAEKELHYGVKESTLSKQHILSVILYCDESDLQKHFTASFRKYAPYQSIELVKQNNREFAHWSKTIRETVELFGWNGRGFKHPKHKTKRIHKLKGPFFCGMSFSMALPEFNMRLCGPTSTTKQVEVATRFAGIDGIIIALNNNGYKDSHCLRAFGCSWLSNYPGEDEYIFCGGRYRIKISSVTTLRTQENFYSFFRAFYYFDCMLDGTDMSWKKRKELSKKYDPKGEIRNTISGLIKHKLKWKEFTNSYPKYINCTFQAFVEHKKQIVINLHFIHKYFDSIRNFILKRNLLKSIVFELFINVQRIIIYSTHPAGSNHGEYCFNLVSLISMINKHPSRQNNTQIIVKASHYYSKKKWVRRSWLFNDEKKLKQLNLNICLTEKSQPDHNYGYEIKEDWLIVSLTNEIENINIKRENDTYNNKKEKPNHPEQLRNENMKRIKAQRSPSIKSQSSHGDNEIICSNVIDENDTTALENEIIHNEKQYQILINDTSLLEAEIIRNERLWRKYIVNCTKNSEDN